MAAYFFYMHMTRYMDSGFQSVEDNYDLLALMIFQFISIGDAFTGKRGGCGGRNDNHGFAIDLPNAILNDVFTAGDWSSIFTIDGKDWLDMLQSDEEDRSDDLNSGKAQVF